MTERCLKKTHSETKSDGEDKANDNKTTKPKQQLTVPGGVTLYTACNRTEIFQEIMKVYLHQVQQSKLEDNNHFCNKWHTAQQKSYLVS